jgi:hypothetical protein
MKCECAATLSIVIEDSMEVPMTYAIYSKKDGSSVVEIDVDFSNPHYTYVELD